jgi:hypothetical protein
MTSQMLPVIRLVYLAFLFSVFQCFSQTEGINHKARPSERPYPISRPESGAALSSNFDLYMDYSTLNGDDNFFVWPFNDGYNNADSAINYAAVAYDRIAGYDTYSPPYTFYNHLDFGLSSPYPANMVMLIDSLYLFITHENNSGNYNRYSAELYELNGNNELSSTLLWSQTDSTNISLSPSGQWFGANSLVLQEYKPSFTTSPGQKMGFRFRYHNPDKLDTLAILAGYKQGLGGVANPSSYNNSFFRFPPFVQSIQRNASYQVGPNAYFLAQNWVMGIKATLYNVSLNVATESSVDSPQFLHNNPAADYAEVRYRHLKNDARLVLRDMQGKQIETMHIARNNSHEFALVQLPCSQLSPGIYLLSFENSEGLLAVSKLVISR